MSHSFIYLVLSRLNTYSYTLRPEEELPLFYFKIPHESRLWDYSIVFSVVDNLQLVVYLQLQDGILQLQDGRLCGSRSDYSICIFAVDSNVIEKSIEGHTGFVRGIIELQDGRLCSCSDDESIKLWNIEPGQCDLNINRQTNGVFCVIQLLDGRLCSLE
jgi:WD40 repeat protein